MKRYNRIMVGLDGKKDDTILLQHIAKINGTLDIQKIYFVHIRENMNLPDNAELIHAEHLLPVDENIRELMVRDIEAAFKNPDELDYEIIVKDGNPGDEMMRLISIKRIDLLVLGRKPKPGITYFSRQLASQASCSVIFVPRSGVTDYKKILVPMDFSSNSKQAIEKAFLYKEENEDAEIMPVHFYSVPSGYSKSGKSYREFSAIMRENADQDCKSSIPGDQSSSCDFVLDKHDNIAKKIFDYSLRKGADLIMIGSKGRTRIASFINKSVAAKLVEISYHLPVIIDKEQQATMGPVKALLKI